jgi:hypothetical protein
MAVLYLTLAKYCSDGTNPEDENDGNNRTGNYIVRVKLERKIPELVPIMGKRVKFFYPGIQRLCTNCFGNHPKRVCRSQKVPWSKYVSDFITSNPQVPRHILGRWAELNKVRLQDPLLPTTMDSKKRNTSTTGSDTTKWVRAHSPNMTPAPCAQSKPAPTMAKVVKPAVTQKTRASTARGKRTGSKTEVRPAQGDAAKTAEPDKSSGSLQPDKASFRIPATEEDHADMVCRLVEAGSIEMEAERIIAMRISSYNKALKEHKKNERLSQAIKPSKPSANINKSNHAN